MKLTFNFTLSTTGTTDCCLCLTSWLDFLQKMDLLNSYASSSDDEVEEEKAVETSQRTGVAVDGTTTSGAAASIRKPNELPASGSASATRKKVLSLVNVLPQHIVDRLMKREVQGDSSDEDDDLPVNNTAARTSTTRTGPWNEKDHAPSVFSSLLSDLKGATPSIGSTAPSAALVSAEIPVQSQRVTEKMGAAFLESTTVIHKSSTKDSSETIRDIHGEEETAKGSNPVASDTGAIPTEKSVAVPRPPGRSISTRIDARDTVPEASSIESHTLSQDKVQEVKNNTKKRSRKELERELRKGNLSAVDGHDNVAQLHSSSGQYHQVDPETYALPEHGVKVVPTALYNPSTGTTDVNSESTKGRGKNQINQLMQSAASLEVARARGLASSSQIGKMHRKKAKQKYGW